MNYLNIIKPKEFKKIKLVEIFFYALPLSFILGNLILSINVLLFIIFSFFLIKKENLTYRFNNTNWFLIIFFLYLFLSTLIQFNEYDIWIQKAKDAFADQPAEANLLPIWQKKNLTLENHPIFKSLILIRFVFLIFLIDTLFYNKILSIKKFFLSSFICTSFVSLDILFQYIFGFDVFGMKNNGRYNSGPFGDELISGGYLQTFSFFSFFYIFFINKNKNLSKPGIYFIIAIHALAIAFSGNRMPLLLFLLGCTILIILIKKIRVVMTIGLTIFVAVFFIALSNDKNIKLPYQNFYLQTIGSIFENDTSNKVGKENLNEDGVAETYWKVGPEGSEKNFLRTTGHARIYITAIEMWKENYLFGFGLKSFRVKCWEILPRIDGLSCANHPHNYYLELLSEAGILGSSLIFIFFIILILKSFKFLIKGINKKNENLYFLIPMILVFFLEIWPLRSTGSFFTNWGSTLFWLNVALLQANLMKNRN